MCIMKSSLSHWVSWETVLQIVGLRSGFDFELQSRTEGCRILVESICCFTVDAKLYMTNVWVLAVEHSQQTTLSLSATPRAAAAVQPLM
jgi:hypothetical protein